MIKQLQAALKEYESEQQILTTKRKQFELIRIAAKKAIALLRRANLQEAHKLITDCQESLTSLAPVIEQNSTLKESSFYKEATEEFAEAWIYYCFLNKNEFSWPPKIIIDSEQQLGGFSDFTGELVRRAITEASTSNLKRIENYRNLTQNIVEELTQAGLSRKLRSKYDATERNLTKIENIIYDLRLLQEKAQAN
jgi:translin